MKLAKFLTEKYCGLCPVGSLPLALVVAAIEAGNLPECLQKTVARLLRGMPLPLTLLAQRTGPALRMLAPWSHLLRIAWEWGARLFVFMKLF